MPQKKSLIIVDKKCVEVILNTMNGIINKRHIRYDTLNVYKILGIEHKVVDF